MRSASKNGDKGICDAEAAAIREEKLADVKKAVDAGDYDSDELLTKAMSRLLDSIGDSE